MFFIIYYWNATPMFFLFIAVYVFRVARCATALNSEKAVESLLSLRLFLNLKQAEGPENIYGVLNVFVKIDNSKLKTQNRLCRQFKTQNSKLKTLIIFRKVLASHWQLMMFQLWQHLLELHEEPLARRVAVGEHVECRAQPLCQVLEQSLVGIT